jgi:large repetitive protein
VGVGGGDPYGSPVWSGHFGGLSEENHWATFPLTVLTQGWVNGTIPNDGILLKSSAEASNGIVQFNDSHSSSAVPSLEVQWDTRPHAPTLVAPAAGAVNQSITPQLSATVSDPDSGAVLYGEFYLRTHGSSTWNLVNGTRTSALSTGDTATYQVPSGMLSAGQSYDWGATTWDGRLDSSTANPPTPSTVRTFTVGQVPDAPTAVSAAIDGDNTAKVSWTAGNAYGATVTGYTINVYTATDPAQSSGGVLLKSVDASASPTDVGGLVNGAYYYFTVIEHTNSSVATDSAESAPSTPPVQATGSPLSPSGVNAGDGQDRQSAVTFTPPLISAPVITSYLVTTYLASNDIQVLSQTFDQGQYTVNSDGTVTVVVTNLVNGTAVHFRVQSVNGYGGVGISTPASSPSNDVTPAGVPFPPTGAAAETDDTGANQAKVSWTPPAARYVNSNDYAETPGDNGRTITTYTATSSPEGKTGTASGEASTSAIVDGLMDGSSYTFTVTATNSVGTSDPSNTTNAVIPSGLPFAPGAPVHTLDHPEDGQASLAWTAPPTQSDGTPGDNGAPITSYTVTASPGGLQQTSTGTSLVFTGLTDGTTYTFTVAATNAKGIGASSAASDSILVAGPPDAPTNVQVQSGDGQATVTWTGSGTHGTPVTSYTVTASPGGASATTADGHTTTATVAGLSNGTNYTFNVVAHSAAGDSAGGSSGGTPAGAPFSPTFTNIQAGAEPEAHTAVLTWDAPAQRSDGTPGDNGSPLTTYTINAIPTDNENPEATMVVASTPAPDPDTSSDSMEVKGLANGQTYRFTITASNARGTSAPSNSKDFRPAVFPTVNGPNRLSGGNLIYHGGPVQSNVEMHLIFWGNQWSNDTTTVNTIENTFARLSGTPWQALLKQYGVQDETLVGSVTDPTVPPQDVDTAGMIREVQKEEVAQGWNHNSQSQFIVFLPATQPQSSYLNGNCALHSEDGGYIMAAVMDDVNGCRAEDGNEVPEYDRIDMLVGGATHEYTEAATDPDGSTGWQNSLGGEGEVADLCSPDAGDTIAGGLVQAIWDNASGACQSH